MRATQVVAPRTVEVVDIPKPEMAPGKVLIRTVLASICGSDWPIVMGARPEATYPMPPGRPGHEIVAVVEDSDAPQFKPGDRVLDTAYDGAMREYHVRDPIDLIPLPADRPWEEMLMAQPWGTVLYAAHRWPSVLGWDAVVIGQGAIGLLFTATLRMLGARKIIGLDLEDHRLKAARAMGASHTVNVQREDPVAAVRELTDGRMADLVVEACGQEETFNLMGALVRREGYITVFGLPKRNPMVMQMGVLMRTDSVILPAHLASAGVAKRNQFFSLARDLLELHRIDVRPLLTHRLPIEEVQRGYELAETRADGAIKVVFEF